MRSFSALHYQICLIRCNRLGGQSLLDSLGYPNGELSENFRYVKLFVSSKCAGFWPALTAWQTLSNAIQTASVSGNPIYKIPSKRSRQLPRNLSCRGSVPPSRLLHTRDHHILRTAGGHQSPWNPPHFLRTATPVAIPPGGLGVNQ
jgi:hypothetical protein